MVKESYNLQQDSSGSMRCLNIIFMVINFIGFVTGILLVIIGAFYFSEHAYIRNNFGIGSSFCSASVFCIIVGFLICLVTVCGFCGACRNSYCFLFSYTVSLSLIILLEVIVVVVFFSIITDSKHEPVVANLMRKTLKNFNEEHKDHGITKAWNWMQTELLCCGVDGPQDWHNASITSAFVSSKSLPESCCGALSWKPDSVSTCSLDSGEIFHVGCLPQLQKQIHEHGVVIGVVTSLIILVQIALVIISSFLTKKSVRPSTCYPCF